MLRRSTALLRWRWPRKRRGQGGDDHRLGRLLRSSGRAIAAARPDLRHFGASGQQACPRASEGMVSARVHGDTASWVGSGWSIYGQGKRKRRLKAIFVSTDFSSLLQRSQAATTLQRSTGLLPVSGSASDCVQPGPPGPGRGPSLGRPAGVATRGQAMPVPEQCWPRLAAMPLTVGTTTAASRPFPLRCAMRAGRGKSGGGRGPARSEERPHSIALRFREDGVDRTTGP